MTSPPQLELGARRSTAAGVACSAAAYVIWGLFPIYFKAVAAVPPVEVLANRIVWSLVFLAAVIGVHGLASRGPAGGWRPVLAAFRTRRLLAVLCFSSIAIAANWVVFIWAVANGRVLECSLGYFINPLVSVLLGVVALGERLSSTQWVAIAFAALGVAHQIVAVGTVPWVALVLAVSFGLYGLLRKTAPIEPIGGLFVEAALLTPPALCVLALAALGGGALLGGVGSRGAALDPASLADTPLGLAALLALAGPLTALPLILFVAGARRLRLATVGLLQYIAPTGHFLLAVLLYGEAFSSAALITFALIWAGLAIYSADAVRGLR